MTEEEAVQYLLKTGLKFFRTGSREICSQAPTDTDVDFVVFDGKLKLKSKLLKDGFKNTGKENDRYKNANFFSYRKGETNIILTKRVEVFTSWHIATMAAKQLNLLKKHERIALHDAILKGDHAEYFDLMPKFIESN